jgi:hypothetical protein
MTYIFHKFGYAHRSDLFELKTNAIVSVLVGSATKITVSGAPPIVRLWTIFFPESASLTYSIKKILKPSFQSFVPDVVKRTT